MSHTSRCGRSALVSVGCALALVGTSGCSTVGPDGGPSTVPTASAESNATVTAPGAQRIPVDVDEVTVEGRDQAHGCGGGTISVEVPSGTA